MYFNKLIFLLFFCFFSNKINAQTAISGEIKPSPNTTFYIYVYQNSDEKLYDSIKTDSEGKFSYKLVSNYKGIVRLRDGKINFDLIIHAENEIEFTINQFYPTIDILFQKSKENTIFYNYLIDHQLFLRKSNLLLPLIYDYPKNDSFYEVIKTKFIRLNENHEKFLDSLVATNPKLLASSVIQFERVPYIHPDTPERKAVEIFQTNFFKYANFHDTLIFQTPMFAKKVVEFLSFYSNQNFTKEQQEHAFMDAASRLMEITYDYPKTYTYLIDYLIRGFKQFGMDNVVDYIAENADIEGSCKNENVDKEVKRRIENLKKMTIGKQAADFEVLDLKGQIVKLSNTKAKYNLVVFWATDCPHCQKAIPKLHDIYKEYSREMLEIYSISLDTSKNTLTNFLQENPTSWINICDLKGWNSPMAKNYNVFATPMMFLLDKDLKIVAKPVDVRELEKILKELN